MLTSFAYFYSLNKLLCGLVFFQQHFQGHFQESLKKFETPYFRDPVIKLVTAGCVREPQLNNAPLLGLLSLIMT